MREDPGCGLRLPKVQSCIEIEGSDDVGVDVRYSWGGLARGDFTSIGCVDTFYLGEYPVTNADFKKFLDATHYRPQDDLNFLRDWKNGGYPEGWAKKPVTWSIAPGCTPRTASGRWQATAPMSGYGNTQRKGGEREPPFTPGETFTTGDAANVPVPDKGRTR